MTVSQATGKSAVRSSQSHRTGRRKTSSAQRNAKADKVSHDEQTINRRGGDRRESERRETAAPVATERRTLERREKVNRRRQIDPTTCERDYTPAEVEFMGALDEYKRKSGRMFPTCSEILEVIMGLGYRQVAPASSPLEAGEAAAVAAAPPVASEAEATPAAVNPD